MVVIRVLGGILLLIALLSLVHDATLTFTGNKGILVTPLWQHWYDISPITLKSIRALVESYSATWVWNNIIVTLLQIPAWATFGIFGTLVCYAGRKRERINVYAN